MSMQTCNECEFALFRDYGYSNYTTEGTEFFCLVGKHPEDGFDRWFGDDERLNYAQVCTGFVSGEPICLDVDGYAEENLTDSEKALLENWGK
jgi:hypothetical protein